MCTRNELIAYLQSLPEYVNIVVLKADRGTWHDTLRWTDLDMDELSNNCNLYSSTLYLGEE